jgi:HEAT repeats
MKRKRYRGSMNELHSNSAYYLERLKGSDWEDVYHSLIEADNVIVPILIKAYRAEADPTIRATLVKIIWQHRVPETISFLSEALDDNHPDVWKNALDGFVALGSVSAIQILESAKQRIQAGNQTKSVRIDWIDEAMQQIRTRSFA